MDDMATEALHSWRKLQEVLNQLTETQLVEMIAHEIQCEKRATVLKRLHQRFTMVRAAREWSEVEASVGK